MRLRLVLLVAAIWLSCIALTWAVAHWSESTVQTSVQVQSNCQQIELLKTVIRASVTQSMSALGRPGTAGYAYYRDHPEELRAAIESDRATIQDFAPQKCVKGMGQ